MKISQAAYAFIHAFAAFSIGTASADIVYQSVTASNSGNQTALAGGTYLSGSIAAARQPHDVVASPANPEKSADQDKAETAYLRLPLAFEINQGQTDPMVKFLCRDAGYSFFLTGIEAVLSLAKTARRNPSAANQRCGDILRFRLLGANMQPQVEGMEPLPGKSNYFMGKDPKQWHTNIPQYAKVKSAQVYPGIDLVYYGQQRQLEYDFQISPGADPGLIRFTVEGAQKVSINPQGDLILKTIGGDVIEQAPIIYQEVDGKRKKVGGGYEVRRTAKAGSKKSKSFAVSFKVAAYDHSKALIIDPVLLYSTYLGGGYIDYANGIAVDSSGNAYVTGETDSTDFPTTAGAFQLINNGGNGAAFVSKLNPTLSGSASLVYSTYLGGSGGDNGSAIAVDSFGNAYVTGQTYSKDFPTTTGAFQTTNNCFPNNTGFVTKLSAAGSALIYSTYIGGSVSDQPYGIAVNSSGNVYVTGYTASADFPKTANAFQLTNNSFPNFTGFVTKLNTAGSALIYSTYLGGSVGDYPDGIAVDSSGNAYVTGGTDSTNFPTTTGAFQATNNVGNRVAFVTKLNPTLSGSASLVYSTYLGGSGGDAGSGIAVDSSGNPYVTGEAYSTDFPTTTGAFQTTNNGGNQGNRVAFVTKLNPTLSGSASLVYSTYLGGSGGDASSGIAVDSSGNAYLTGEAYSTDFPTTMDAYQMTNKSAGQSSNAFVTILNTTLSGTASLIYSTYLGGSGGDLGYGITVDSAGNAYVTGQTNSTDFPTTAGAFQTTNNGAYSSGFVARFNIGGPTLSITMTGNSTVTLSWSAYATAWTLQQASLLAPVSNWTNVTALPAFVNGLNQVAVTLSSSNSSQFYRLTHP